MRKSFDRRYTQKEINNAQSTGFISVVATIVKMVVKFVHDARSKILHRAQLAIPPFLLAEITENKMMDQ